MRKEIRIAGFGGQGVALAGMVLGKALTIYEDMEAVMTQAYGPEARGGASSANVVLSDHPIAYPFVQTADVLVALSQEAYTKFRPETQPQAQILVDQELVVSQDDDKVFAIPATRMAKELGRRMVTNMVMLGFLTAVSELVQMENMQRAIETSVKPNTITLNLQAFNAGYEYGLAHYPKPALVKEQGT
jgi:2-oxoglutarate ferredoxin oxidoreductase subunit gamma